MNKLKQVEIDYINEEVERTQSLIDKAVLEERQERDTHWKNELRNRYQKGVEAERKRIKKLLDEKIVGKGEDEMFDQGAYEENRQIYKAIEV